MNAEEANAPFGYDAELVDGELVFKPNADAEIIKMAFGLFNDLTDVYRKYEFDNAASLALKSTKDALNSLQDASETHARFQQSREYEHELAKSMMKTYKRYNKIKPRA